MKKLLLLLIGVVCWAIPAQGAYWLLTSQTDFASSSATSLSYALLHPEKESFMTEWSSQNFIALPKNTSDWETQAQTFSNSDGYYNGVFNFTTASESFQRVKFEKITGTETYRMKFGSDNNTYFYGVDENGFIITGYSAKPVTIDFYAGAYATVHCDGKELQLIDNQFKFAEPTDSKANKLYLFVRQPVSSYKNFKTVSIYMRNPVTGSNATTLTVDNDIVRYISLQSGTSQVSVTDLRIASDKDYSSFGITVSSDNTTLTIAKDATPGTYYFTGYYNYTYNGNFLPYPTKLTLIVKKPNPLVWVCDGKEIETTDYTVEWNPNTKFEIWEKNSSTGKLVTNWTTSSYYENGEFYKVITLSTNGTSDDPFDHIYSSSLTLAKVTGVTYPRTVNITGTFTLLQNKIKRSGNLPDLNLTITAMKPQFTVAAPNMEWSNNTIEVPLTSPGLPLRSNDNAVKYLTASIEPAQQFTDFDVTEAQLDGNFDPEKTTAAINMSAPNYANSGVIDVKVPCSGLYNLIVQYNGAPEATPYVNPDYKSVIPLNIYPTTTELELGIVSYNSEGVPNPDKILRKAPISNGVWTGPMEYENATSETSAYRYVALSSNMVAGISGYYKTGNASSTPEAASMRVDAPEGYDFTDAATGQFMNLFDVNALSVRVAKNGAIAPEAFDITLDKKDHVISGISSVAADRPEGPEEFFTLEGIKIATPREGQIYILRRGSEVSKIVYSQSK